MLQPVLSLSFSTGAFPQTLLSLHRNDKKVMRVIQLHFTYNAIVLHV